MLFFPLDAEWKPRQSALTQMDLKARTETKENWYAVFTFPIRYLSQMHEW